MSGCHSSRPWPAEALAAIVALPHGSRPGRALPSLSQRYRFDPVRDEWLSIGDVAHHLGLRESEASGLMARGDLATQGFPPRVRRSELEAFIRRSSVRPPVPRPQTSMTASRSATGKRADRSDSSER